MPARSVLGELDQAVDDLGIGPGRIEGLDDHAAALCASGVLIGRPMPWFKQKFTPAAIALGLCEGRI